jgi:hypothetical protein
MSSGNHFAFEYPELLIKQQDQIVRKNQNDINKAIHIHEDVWVGNGVFIAQGITIGRGAVVGAGAIVTKDIEPYQVVVGNPAKPIKTRLNFNPPAKIESSNQKDLPYFYQGFDHYQMEDHRKEIGLQIIDKAQVKLKKGRANFQVSGWSKHDFELKLVGLKISETFKQPKGEFHIHSSKLDANGTLNFELLTGAQSQVFIQSIICN